jgi:hypothetical protein
MRNKYPAPCTKCGETVDANEGDLVNVKGEWRVQHFKCREKEASLKPIFNNT